MTDGEHGYLMQGQESCDPMEESHPLRDTPLPPDSEPASLRQVPAS